MSEEIVKFYRLIPESVWDNEEEIVRKVSVWRKYKTWQETLGVAVGFESKSPIREFGKIYCKTNKTCERQICRSVFQPNCPHSKERSVFLERRRRKEYLEIKKPSRKEEFEKEDIYKKYLSRIEAK